MNEHKLVTVPDPLLRQVSEPIDSIDGLVKEIAEYMLAQLGPLEAAGFAAPQFGELKRVIVVKVDKDTGLTIVNPEVVKERGFHIVVEGCRSIPGKWYQLRRPKIVKVKGLSLEGEPIIIKGRGFLAQVLMHEVDHLDGVLIDSIGELTEL